MNFYGEDLCLFPRDFMMKNDILSVSKKIHSAESLMIDSADLFSLYRQRNVKNNYSKYHNQHEN